MDQKLNAFHWRETPPTVNFKGKSERQVLLDATRENTPFNIPKTVPIEVRRKKLLANI